MMNMKKLFRKDRLPLFIVGIVSLVVVGAVVSYTYSFFAVNKSNNNVIAGEAESMSIDLKVEKKAPNNDNKLVPQLDEYITSAVKGVNGSCVDGNNNNVCQVYKITVKNGGSTTTQLNGEVVLDAKDNPNLKWAVISGEATSGAKPTLKSNVYSHTHKALTTKEEYTGGQIKEYYIVVWISETGLGQEDTGKFTGVVNFKNINDGSGDWGTTSIDNSGANAPAYTEGLIPVMYDESTSKWVKADTTSSTSEYGWYDYDNKKWANAVLVKDIVSSEVVYGGSKDVSIYNPIGSYTISYFGYDDWDNCPDGYCIGKAVFTFTTGSSGGNLSFDYKSWEDFPRGEDFKIKLNEAVLVDGPPSWEEYGDCGYIEEGYPDGNMSCYYTNSYSVNLTPNTSYTLEVTYDPVDAGIGGGYITISNISLPNDLSVPFSVSVTEDSGGLNVDGTLFKSNSYTINENGEFVLGSIVNAFGGELIDKYICGDGTTKTCEQIYKIKTVDGNTITSVDYYNTEKSSRQDLMSADPGTEIPEEAVLAYYVWIPRYKYKVWNKDKVIGVDVYNASTEGIDIEFEVGTSTTGEVTCTYDFGKIATDTVRNEECTGVNGKNFYTHPAFTFGEDELTGFWMGKYEISSTVQECTGEWYSDSCGGGHSTTLTPRILPNVFNWAYNSLDNYSTVIKNMQVSNNIYGLSTDLTKADSHMITNMEWGAVAYLTNSDYGMCANETCSTVLNNRLYYEEEASITASGGSTTNNIYGVYDMNGGAEEIVGGKKSVSSLGKYITTYDSDELDTYIRQRSFNITRLGDAIGEVVSSDFYIEYEDEYGGGTASSAIGVTNGWRGSYVNAPSGGYVSRGGTSSGSGNGYIYDVDSSEWGVISGTRASLAVFP